MAIKYIVNPLASAGLAPLNDVSQLVEGPISSTDNAIARFDGTSGLLLKNSTITVADSGVLTLGADGVGSLDAVTVQQLQAVQSGVQIKQGVACATTANITLLGEQTIDDILTSSSRVLVKNQSIQTENGIYVSSSGVWSRSSDMDANAEFLDALVTVEDGTVNANTGWYQTTNPVTVGVSNIVFIQFFGAGTYTADGNGIKITGSTFFLSLDGSTLSQSASGVKVATGGISNNEVNASAAIAYSKLNLANSIVNADVSSSAAIAYSKLNLSNSILNADINSAAAIAYSKLSLSNSIVNADIASAAAIDFSKLASLTSAHILVGSAGNVATDVAVTGDISLSNTGVTAYSGTVPLNKGGTGQTTKAPAFDALSPMTTGGDIIYGGASGTGTRLANGSSGQVLTSGGGTAAPSWTSVSPTFVGCKYTGCTNGSIANNGSATLLYKTSVYDTASAYNTGTGEFTVPSTGYYQIIAGLITPATTSGSGNRGLQLGVVQNGTIRNQFTDWSEVASNSHVWQCVVQDQLLCTASQVITIRVDNQVGNAFTPSDDANNTYLMIVKLGT